MGGTGNRGTPDDGVTEQTRAWVEHDPPEGRWMVSRHEVLRNPPDGTRPNRSAPSPMPLYRPSRTIVRAVGSGRGQLIRRYEMTWA